MSAVSKIDRAATDLAAPIAPDTGNVWHRRLIAGVLAMGSAGVLGIAAWLPASPTGLGTHQALNLPPCGWIIWADLPCPTCGMTTAFAHAADGNLLASIHAQPLGFVLALATAMTFLASLHVLVTGSRLGSVPAKLLGWSIGWIIAGMVLLAWGYKIASYKGWIS